MEYVGIAVFTVVLFFAGRAAYRSAIKRGFIKPDWFRNIIK